MNVVPPINAFGKYTVALPFTIQNYDYRCVNIETIASKVAKGIDVYALHYLEHGVPIERYNADLADNISIITLVSDYSGAIDIPSSFILTIPSDISVLYTNKILSINLGLVPNTLNLATCTAEILNTVHDNIGISASIKTIVLPNERTYSDAEHRSLESARTSIISNPISSTAAVLALTSEVATLRAHIRMLEGSVMLLSK